MIDPAAARRARAALAGIPLAAALASAAAGCGVYRSPRNAPWHIDVATPPASIADRRLEPPRDPGENVVWLTYGALAAAGLASPNPRYASAAYSIGPEVSLHVGRRDRTSPEGEFLPLPFRGVGVNLGWTALSGSAGHGVGPLYGELQLTSGAYWLAGGWAWDPDDHVQGPQGSMGLGPLFLRYGHLFDREGALVLGLAIKGGPSWLRSR